ncbi:MAG: HNH endonuclease [Clostridiales bacterium]|nr:HNH endonuclease [Clostridiales bacterium]
MYEKLAVGTNRGKRICQGVPEKSIICGKEFSFDEFEIDHKQACSKGGRTALNNAQLPCKKCNTAKGAR